MPSRDTPKADNAGTDRKARAGGVIIKGRLPEVTINGIRVEPRPVSIAERPFFAGLPALTGRVRRGL